MTATHGSVETGSLTLAPADRGRAARMKRENNLRATKCMGETIAELHRLHAGETFGAEARS